MQLTVLLSVSLSQIQGGKTVKQIKKVILITLMITFTACSAPEKSEEIILLQAQDNTLLENNTLISPYTFSEKLATVYDTKPVETVLKAADSTRTGYSWMISKVSTGMPASVTTTIRSTYDAKGNLLSDEQVPGSAIETEATPTVYQYGAKVSVGSYFYTSLITRYGYDCVGCNIGLDGAAGTASGIRVKNTSVRQASGIYTDTLTYEGYYIVAADKAFPFCTILEIENRNMSGYGLVPGKPFKAIVLDRGGAIKTTHLDLYAGSEKHLDIIDRGMTNGLKVTVVDFLDWTKNNYGQAVCR